MRRRRRVQAGLLGLILLLVAVVGIQVAAALPRAAAPGPTRTPVDWRAVPVGSDASWPSCTPPRGTTTTMPLAVRPSFVVVGLNDGLPGTTSACVERELRWADSTTGGSSQPRLAYYVMAADPWTTPERRWVKDPSWPVSDTVDGTAVRVPGAFGAPCTGGHAEQACAYVYGWAMARYAARIPGVADPGSHRFWIDVEAERTWSDDQGFNQAVVEGMVAAFTAPASRGGVGTTAGIYTDRSEWVRIIGPLRSGSPLDPLDEWLAVGRTSKAAAIDALRHDWPITASGRIRMVQWVDGRIDRDVAAPG